MIDARRGVLYPARLPELHRLPPGESVRELVEWFWIPVWDIEQGRTSRQHVLAYPALNLVVEVGGVELHGPSTRASHRDLEGSGWAVGALLKPASALTVNPVALRDASVVFEAPELHDEIVTAMRTGDEAGRERAVAAFSAWLAARIGALTPTDRLANVAVALLLSDAGITRPEQAATRLAISVRTLERLAHRYVGLPPAAMIRRRRLQEAAQRIRDDPSDLATIAAELGYADHAHLTNDFRAALGFTPSAYRASPPVRLPASRSIR